MEEISTQDGRGRPPKDPKKKKSEWVTIRICPSEAKIVQQEAKRCAIKEAIVYRKYGLRKLIGDITLPSPEVLNWVVGAGQLLTGKGKKKEISRNDLTGLSAEIGARRGEVKSHASRREELRNRASTEPREVKKNIRITEKRKRLLEEIVEKRGLPSISTALGKGALTQIKESEHLGDILKLLDRWDDLAGKILEEVTGSERPVVDQDGVVEKIKALGTKMGKGAKRIHQARHS